MKFKMPRGIWWGWYSLALWLVLIVFLPKIVPEDFGSRDDLIDAISGVVFFVGIGFWIDAFINRKKPKTIGDTQQKLPAALKNSSRDDSESKEMRLNKLVNLYEEGLISRREFETVKQEIFS
jgi:hypothetical protein